MDDPRISGNMFDRQVPTTRIDSVFPLPLNLIALIISYVRAQVPCRTVNEANDDQLDQSSDLSRMCRTCRVFHYMTLPQLYSHVALRSYSYIRYCEMNGRPGGLRHGQPLDDGLEWTGLEKRIKLCQEVRNLWRLE